MTAERTFRSSGHAEFYSPSHKVYSRELVDHDARLIVIDSPLIFVLASNQCGTSSARFSALHSTHAQLQNPRFSRQSDK